MWFGVVLAAVIGLTNAIYLQGTDSYATYPKWNACVNASISFEFKTSMEMAMLMYVDDGGKYDFMQVLIFKGRVELKLNIVKERDGNVKIMAGDRVDDGSWHRITITRRRMQTILKVDDATASRFAYGSDFTFGGEKNSPVYFGGLSRSYNSLDNLVGLATPSVLLQKRLRGSLRNVIYSNCTCDPVRAQPIGGKYTPGYDDDGCQGVRCQEGCLCVATSHQTHECDCQRLKCSKEEDVFILPMDSLSLQKKGHSIDNPSGLDAILYTSGGVKAEDLLVPGIKGNAVKLDGLNSYIQVTGRAHRFECLGDLTLCSDGYTLAFWFRIDTLIIGETIIVSNGGHTSLSHGVAISYDRGSLKFRFRRKDAREWTLEYDQVPPMKWYHVVITWSSDYGLSLYLNGKRINGRSMQTYNSADSIEENSDFDSFLIGRANDVSRSSGRAIKATTLYIDEFKFYSRRMEREDIGRLGAFYKYELSMDKMSQRSVLNTRLSNQFTGQPSYSKGKIEGAVLFNGKSTSLVINKMADKCYGNLTLCDNGFMISMWMKFLSNGNNMYYLSTGNADIGMQMYQNRGKVHFEAANGKNIWKIEKSFGKDGEALPLNQWMFFELTWSEDSGLSVYVDQKLVTELKRPTGRISSSSSSANSRSTFTIAHSREQRYASYGHLVVDELHMWNAHRQKLIDINFISRGDPNIHIVTMDKLVTSNTLHHMDSPALKYDIKLYYNPRLVSNGRMGSALSLNGNTQYADFGKQSGRCFGNLDRCYGGALFTIWFKPQSLADNMQLVSTGGNGISIIYQRSGRLDIEVKTTTKVFKFFSHAQSYLKVGNWYFLEIDYTPEYSVTLYINQIKVVRQTFGKKRSHESIGYLRQPEYDLFYLGRGDGSDNDIKYADALIDQLEYYSAERQYLLAFNYIQRNKPFVYLIRMNRIQNNRIAHKTLTINTYGRVSVMHTVKGQTNVVKLSSGLSYLDIRDAGAATCFGSPASCEYGFTISFWLLTKDTATSNQLYHHSRSLLVELVDRKLYVELMLVGKIYKISSSYLNAETWHFIEISYSQKDGLSLYVDNERRAHTKTTSSSSRLTSDANDNLITIGKSTNDYDSYYSDIRYWYSNRKYLYSNEYVKPVETRTPIIVNTNEVIDFGSDSYVVYNYNRIDKKYLSGDVDNFKFRVRTNSTQKMLIFFTEDGRNKIYLYVEDGVVKYANKQGNREDIFSFKNARINDNMWHDIEMNRKDDKFTIIVDGIRQTGTSSMGMKPLISNTMYYVGGYNFTYKDFHNFTGSLTQFEMGNGATVLDMIRQYLERSEYVTRSKDITINIGGGGGSGGRGGPTEHERPVSFTDGNAFVRFAPLSSKGFRVHASFRTQSPAGLLFLIGQTKVEYIAIEIYDGRAFVVFGKPGEESRHLLQTTRVDDGSVNEIQINYEAGRLMVILNGQPGLSNSVMPMQARKLPLSLAGHNGDLPWSLWTYKSRTGFIGCIWKLEIQSADEPTNHVDLRNQIGEGMRAGCPAPKEACHMKPCQHGTCRDLTSGAHCSCVETAYTGSRCDRKAQVYTFNAKDNVVMKTAIVESHTNDFVIRFKTYLKNTELLRTSNTYNRDGILISLTDGRVKVSSTIGGAEKSFYFCKDFNDNNWHTLTVQRRANYIYLQSSKCPSLFDFKQRYAQLPSRDYLLDISTITIGSNLAGYMSHVLVDHYTNVFPLIRSNSRSDVVVTSTIDVDNMQTRIISHPVTFRANTNSYLSINNVKNTKEMQVSLLIKTTSTIPSLLYYSYSRSGSKNLYVALELRDGQLYLGVSDGTSDKVIRVSNTHINDDAWHRVTLTRDSSASSVSVRIDEEVAKSTPLSRDLSLTNTYIGGAPLKVYENLSPLLLARRSYSGCMASFTVRGHSLNLMLDNLVSNEFVTEGCTSANVYCTANTCKNHGICRELLSDYTCDCNMTSYVGRHCSEEAIGLLFTKEVAPLIYYITPIEDSSRDRIAFGFMTYQKSSTILRMNSKTTTDYIAFTLNDGQLIVTYSIGGEVNTVKTREGRRFNDAVYHWVSFERVGDRVTFNVDGDTVYRTQKYDQSQGSSVVFTDVYSVVVGGKTEAISPDNFKGIIAGVYYNRIRVIDREVSDPTSVYVHSIIVPFELDPKDKEDGGAGGGGGKGKGGDGGNAIDPKTIPWVGMDEIDGAAGEGARASAITGAFFGILAALSSIAWAAINLKPPMGGGGGSPPKTPVVGKPKPPAGAGSTTTYTAITTTDGGGSGGGFGGGSGGGYGGGGGGGNSSFAAGVNVTKMEMQSMGGGGGGGYGSSYTGQTSNQMSSQGTAAGQASSLLGAAVANERQNFSSNSYFSSTHNAYNTNLGQASGIADFVSGGIFITRAVQTDLPYYGGTLASGFVTLDMIQQQQQQQQQGTLNYTNAMMSQNDYQSYGGGGGGDGGGYQGGQGHQQGGQGQGYGDTNLGYSSQDMRSYSTDHSMHSGYADQTRPVRQEIVVDELPPPNQQSAPMSPVDDVFNYSGQRSMVDQSTISNAYKMQNIVMNNSSYQTSQQQQHNNRMMSPGGGATSPASYNRAATPTTGLMSSEEIRVDCVILAEDSERVITGSLDGPPQVWHMKTGELISIMQGENESCTDLHIACNGSILVGQVADISTQQDSHLRKLQLWDLASGEPLNMPADVEHCTAICLMNDDQRICMARTEPYGKSTTIVLWDLLANEMIRKITYESAIGFADAVSYLSISDDNRFVVAGFQNSYDTNANFIVFDLSQRDKVDAKIIAFDANVQCTCMLTDHEVVTATRSGQLLVWSLKTQKVLRQYVAPNFANLAHSAEIKALCLSADKQFLISASTDTTLKQWNVQSEKLVSTMQGHTDEVWCCTISNDNEMIISGSKDGTIRLWKNSKLSSVFHTGINVFKVNISGDKQTIVALADKSSTRKIVMLQVIRTKNPRSQATSRCTSPGNFI